MNEERLRISVAGPAPLVIAPSAADVQRYAAATADERVSELPRTANDVAQGIRRFEVIVGGWRFEATAESASRAALRDKAARAATAQQAHAALTVRAQIPGRVVRVWVTDGEAVEQGQRLLAIEAMKMENEIRAPHGGTVGGLRVELGQTVELGDALLVIG